MKKFYVIGNKTSQSLSPTIFNYWFLKYKIKAKYSFVEIKENQFDRKIQSVLKIKNLSGLNITIPFKQKIMKHTNVLDVHSKKINAVNCLSFGSKIKGINTDWEGFYRALPKKIKSKKNFILIIGYGGAALAIHYVLIKKGFKKIAIINRTRKKLNFISGNKYTSNMNMLNKYLVRADLIINTTPINPINKSNKKFISKKTFLNDIVYKPKETSFLSQFPNNNKIYGISMLLEQAASCFKFWFGFQPAIDLRLMEILEKKLK